MWNGYLAKYISVTTLVFLIGIPILLVTYPFRKSLKQFIDDDYVYELGGAYKGLKVYVPNYDTDIMQKYFILMDKVHDFDFIEDFTKRFLKKDMVIFDIGGNVGNHTMYWSIYSRPKKIYTFEPNPHTFGILSKNIELNHLADKVNLFNCGCGSKEGKCDIVIDANNSGAARMSKNTVGKCKIITIDSLDVSQLDFIKIDVEGMEYDVILGARNTLKKHRPLILLEIFEENYNRVNNLLCSLGYEKIEYDLINWRHDYLYGYKGTN